MPKNQQRKVKQHQEAKANDGGHLVKQNMHEIEGEASSRGNPRTNRSTGVSYCRPTRENFKLIASGLDVNQTTLPHGLGSNFVTPPKILKRQLTGYCTLLASSPMGRDNKHGWYEKHEKLVAIAAGSLSSVLLIGDSLVNGLARYHRVWSKYFKPLRALNFGVGGNRTQHVLWRIENGEIPLNLQVVFVHCGTNNLDRDNPDEIRDGIASIVYAIQERKPKAAVIGVTESKLDATVLDGEVNIDGYEVIRSDRNRHGGGVACYVRNDISFNVRRDFSDEIENIVFDMLLPKTKPILVGFLYRPPDQSKFLDKLSTAISRSNTFDNQEVYILGDLNINLINKQKHIPNGIKRYKEFCSLYGLEQLISTSTRVTMNSSSILDHILTNSTDRVSQSGVIDTGLSDHQLIYCTRKITRTKFNSHKNITIRSLKNYSQDVYLEELNKINFPDYSKFTDINDAYSDFIGKVSLTIDKIAPMKEIRIKNSSKEWFDEEILEEIEKRDKLLAKFKKSRQPSDS